ncbi:MAG: geranylgeranyl reductase family protein [Planctomycetaceae bacterium]
MKHCDVLIVGGGPAGSSCAGKLHRHGVDVLLIDKQTFPRDKTCAGWITPPVLDLLDISENEYSAQHVMQPITRFRTGLIGGREIETNYSQTVSYGIRRCEFDHYLLQRSKATSQLGYPLKNLKRENQQWIVNDEISTQLLIGAGGHFCPVGRELGNRKQPGSSVVAAQEIEFEVDAALLDRGTISGDCPELFFCQDLQGYGWCFRKGNFLNIGLGRVDRQNISDHVENFCEFLRSRGKVVCEIPTRKHGHAYQLYERTLPRLYDDGVLLIGDSAGLSYAQSGEGIRPAIESGLIAADVVLSANENYQKKNLESYREKIIERFGQPRKKAPSDWLPAGMLRFLAGRLMATHWFSRRVILDNWFLHTKESALPQQYL